MINSRITISELSDILGTSRQAIHSKLHKKGIKSIKSGKISYITHQESKQFFNFSFVQKKYPSTI